jgi:transcriptional regulator NrdR family protein
MAVPQAAARRGIPCTECDGPTTVTDTRPTTIDDNLGASTRRRRSCDRCGHRFTTYETLGSKTTEAFEEMVRITAEITLANAEQAHRLVRLTRLLRLV